MMIKIDDRTNELVQQLRDAQEKVYSSGMPFYRARTAKTVEFIAFKAKSEELFAHMMGTYGPPGDRFVEWDVIPLKHEASRYFAEVEKGPIIWDFPDVLIPLFITVKIVIAYDIPVQVDTPSFKRFRSAYGHLMAVLPLRKP